MFRDKNKAQFESGFTVAELMVVFLIIVLLSGAGVVLWNNLLPKRSLTLAQNELVTNVKKTQSYAVSARNLEDGSAVKFYIIKFANEATQYTIHAISYDGSYQTKPLETFNLPTNLEISQIYGSGSKYYGCVYVLYSVPFGKTYFYTVPDTKTCDAQSDTDMTTAASYLPLLASNSDQAIYIEFQHPAKSLSNTTGIFKLSSKVEAQ